MYRRFFIKRKKVPNITFHPQHFSVKVNRFQLLKLLIKEWFHYKNVDVVKSRPCVYGVFSGPLGGFAPRERLCVGCLRCTTQYPKIVTILKNPKRDVLGDSYFTPDHIATILYEAESGRVPVKGAGYRGPFGGKQFDGMWTDMSEIVRPTRDGIHGREFISTEIDIGEKLPFLKFDKNKKLVEPIPQLITIPLPLIFDVLPKKFSPKNLSLIFANAANQMSTFAIEPITKLLTHSKGNDASIPLILPEEFPLLEKLSFKPRLIEMEGWDLDVFQKIQTRFPQTLFLLRTSFDENLVFYYNQGVRNFHLTANYHGESKSKKFILDSIREAHLAFVQAKIRDQVTVIGSGGIIAAEHLPKALLCGLDAVALDTPLLVALQATFKKECVSREESHLILPKKMDESWAIQRIKNLVWSWHSQLLEIMGAMGLREVRRMRGEMGRVLFQKDLEKEAFSKITNYDKQID